MHEYSVVNALISGLLPRLENHPGKVTAVYLRKGEMRILSDYALKSAFEILAQGTRLEGARLEIETVEARVKCPKCGYFGKAEYINDPAFHLIVPIITCPKCGAEVEVLSGKELYIDRVSVELPEEDRD